MSFFSSIFSLSNHFFSLSKTKDREIAKLKALLFEKDNEIIALTSTHKKTLSQVEHRMERERKAWSEHNELLLAGERAKFEEEKTRLFKDLQQQLDMQRERCEQIEKKYHEAQMVSEIDDIDHLFVDFD